MKKGNKVFGWIIALIVAGCGLWLCSDWRLQGDDEAERETVPPSVLEKET